jgi:mannose-6-phosphate isomerase-like protein (cupin superfamily)
MNKVLALNHEKLTSDPRFAMFATELTAISSIDSTETFNRYCREACRLWHNIFSVPVGETTSRFTKLMDQIERRDQDVIKTKWGGVVITRHEGPNVEKFLVIRQGGYLALEMHEDKVENLEVLEGAGLILWRRAMEQTMTVEPLKPGAQFHFEPGMEHCLIGTENLLVSERAIDPKGMDQDLIFIYEPDESL